MSGSSAQSDRAPLHQSDFFNSHFVPQVLSVLANDGRHRGKPPIPSVLDMLVGCMLSGNREALTAMTAECRRLHLTSEVMVDTYIPAAVGRIGARWHEDEIDILTATIAFARLQTLLRDLGRNWRADDFAASGQGGAVLLLVPEGDQHTLGALVAANQLRRRGISVTIKLALTALDMDAMLARGGLDAVFVSVGNVASLESAAKLIKIARRPGSAAPPIIVGGSVPVDSDRMREVTGADLATRDVEFALGQLGLGVSMPTT